MGRGVLLTSNLPQLQNLIKRDPPAYKEEFLQQWNHYNSIRQIFQINPDENAQHFRELVSFIAQVRCEYAQYIDCVLVLSLCSRLHNVTPRRPPSFPLRYRPCSSKAMARFLPIPANLSYRTWSCYATRMSLPQSRMSVVVVHDVAIPYVSATSSLLQTLFPLLPRTTSSSLRAFIRKTILSDIRTANLRSKNHKLNRAVQAMLFGMVERGMDAEVVGDKGKLRAAAGKSAVGSNGEEAMWAVVLTKELWRKGIWYVLSAFVRTASQQRESRNDAKAVSIIALGCFHPVVKVQSASLHFFLGSDEEKEDSDEEEDDVGCLHSGRLLHN